MEKKVIEQSASEARKYFLDSDIYSTMIFPEYICFNAILKMVNEFGKGEIFCDKREIKPHLYDELNHSVITNKDGRFAWRNLQLIHPVIYVDMINTICDQNNWNLIRKQFDCFKNGIVECCSIPRVKSRKNKKKNKSHAAIQISNWSKRFEKKCVTYSLDFNQIAHADVANCYG